MSDLTDWDDDILSEDETDNGIIELTDIAEDDPDNEVDETIIELTDIAEEDDSGLSLDITTEDEVEIEEEFEGLELDLETQSPVEDVSDEIETESVQDLSVTQEQLEAALERVIEKKFADKIEPILFEKMEKVIEREIADIKESLQKDLDQIGNV